MIMDHPRAFAIARLLKKSRTKVGLLVAAWCIGEGIYSGERPYSLEQLNIYVAIGLILIAAGVAFRIAALGCIRKKEVLATEGVYSLCRHPLYLGSILLAYGFCVLLADFGNYVWVTAYFAIYYPVTILWEEERLTERYPDAYGQYRATTPRLLPFGAFRKGVFAWKTAFAQGASHLFIVVAIMLAGVELMARAPWQG